MNDSFGVKVVHYDSGNYDTLRYSWRSTYVDSIAVISLLDIAVLIAAISVFGVTIIAFSQSCDPVSADIVALWCGGVEEIALVAGATLVGEVSDVVERGVAVGARQGVVKLDYLQTPAVTQTVP